MRARGPILEWVAFVGWDRKSNGLLNLYCSTWCMWADGCTGPICTETYVVRNWESIRQSIRCWRCRKPFPLAN